jgi:Phage terminase large subunit
MYPSIQTNGTTKPRHLIATFSALPWQIAPWRDRSPVLLLTGSAGGGKSRLAAEKLHGFCLKYPNATALLIRKARVSITNSTAELLRRVVIGDDVRVVHVPSKSRFEYRNGSVLMYTGLDDDGQRQRLRSIGTMGGVDIAWMEEATEFEEDDFNAVLARLRGNAAHWRQVMLTTNPDAPTHWIYRRLIAGREAMVYYSSAMDNRHNPDDYQGRLASLTGVEGDRLARGQWAQATGLIFDTWTDPGNVTDDAEYVEGAGPIFWAVDDGYSAGSAPRTVGIDPTTHHYVGDAHPRVFLLVQQRDDGRLCVFAEHYACLKLSDAHIDEVLALTYTNDKGEQVKYPAPDYCVHGPGAAEIRGRFQAAGLYARQSTANVEESIKETRRALAADANGWRRILVHPRCKHLRAEMASYRRDTDGRIVKAFDHGPDSLRGLAWVLRWEV